MADKAALTAMGFDPSFIDNVIQDFGAAAQPILDLMDEVKAKGLGVAVIVDCVQTFWKYGAPIIQDVLSLLSSPDPHTMVAMKHPLAMAATAGAGSRPFIDWLKANASTLGPFLLQILMGFLKVP